MKKKAQKFGIISFIIPVFFSFIFLLIGGYAPFGNKDIFTATGNERFITYYFKLCDYFHGDYSFQNIKDIWCFYLTDPINLISCLFGRNHLIDALSFIHVLKLGLSGWFFFLYLSLRPKSTKEKNETISLIPVILSSFYALSGYMITYGAAISFSSVVAFFPLIVLSFEKMIYEKKHIYYFFALLISAVLNIYASAVVFIFLCLYFFTLEYSNRTDFLNNCIKKIGIDLLILCSISPLIYLNYNNSEAIRFFYQETPYNFSIANFFTFISRLLALNVPSSFTETAFGIDVYCGLITLFLLICYILSSHFNLFTKIRRITLIAFLAIGTILSGPNTLLNALADSKTNQCFFAFGLIFLLLVISYDVLVDLKYISKPSIILSSTITSVLIILGIIFATDYYSTVPFIVSINIIVIICLIILYFRSANIQPNKICNTILIMGLIEIVTSFLYSGYTISQNSPTYIETNSASQYEAERYINSISKEAKYKVYETGDVFFNPILNTLNGYKYVICPTDQSTPDANLSLIKTIHNTNIYVNNDIIDGMIVADKKLQDWSFTKTTPYISSNSLLNYISGEETTIFEKIKCDVEYTSNTDKASAEVLQFDFSFHPEKECHLYSTYLYPCYLGYSEKNAGINHIYYYYNYNSVEYNKATHYYYSFNKLEFSSILNNIKNITESSDYNFEKDSFIILSINQKPDKTIKIDDTTYKPELINDVIWGIPVTAGTHNISIITYQANNTKPIILLLVSVLAIALLLVASKIRNIINTLIYKIQSLISDNYTYCISIILSIAVLLFAMMIRSCVPFGNSSTLLGDGYAQTIPNLYNYYSGLKLKSFNFGTLGFNRYFLESDTSTISTYLNVFINLIFKLFIQLLHITGYKSYFTVIGALYYSLSSVSVIFYFSHRVNGKRISKHNPYLILISLLYTLSSYIIGYFLYNNFMYGIYVPLIILAMEYAIYNKKTLPYILLLSCFMIRSYYEAFLLCEFLALYYLTLKFDNIKDFIVKSINFAISSILSAAIALSGLIAGLILYKSSTYSTADSISENATASFNLASSVTKSLSQYQVGQNGIYSSLDDYMVNIYAGLLPLLFIGIYALNKNINLSLRIRKLILLLILFYAFGNNTLNYIFHGFHFQAMAPNRFSIFFIFLLLQTFADTIIDFNKLATKKLVISSGLIAAILTICWCIYPEKNKTSFSISIAFLLMYIITIVYHYFKKTKKTLLKKFLLYIGIIEILIGGTITFTTSIGHENNILEDNISSIGILSKNINNSVTHEAYYSEYITDDLNNLNMGNLNRLYTISGFQSGLNQKSFDLAKNWGLSAAANNISYRTGNPLADMMLRLRYHYIDTDDDLFSKSSIYNKIDSINNIELYENPYYLPIAFVTSSDLIEWSNMDIYSFSSMLEYQNAFSEYVCGDTLYEEILPPEENDNPNETYMETSIGEKTMYKTNSLNIHLHVADNIQGKIYIFCGTEIQYVGDTKQTTDNTFDFEMFNYISSDDYFYNFHLAVLKEDTVKKLYDVLSESAMNNYTLTKDDLTGSIDVKSDGILYLSIPNSDNKIVYIDNTPVETFDYLYGTGSYINKGTHTISIRAKSANTTANYIISLIALIIAIVYSVFLQKHNETKHNTKEITKESEENS